MPGSLQTLTKRKQAILNIIVEQYIHTANSVGSGKLAYDYGLGISPATIRNELAELEDAGYIRRPHLSAGAQPSDRGYRYYVERLVDASHPPPGMRSLIRKKFSKMEKDVESWTRLAAGVLSQVVQNVVIATHPAAEESRIRRVELVQLEEFLVMLILVFQQTRLRNQLLPLAGTMAEEDLNVVANKLNDRFAGMTRNQVRADELKLSPLESRVMEETIHLMRVEDEEVLVAHHIEGLSHMLGQPEFSSAGRAREAVEILANRDIIRALLLQAPESGVGVVIGAENSAHRLRPYSVVICQYGDWGTARGIVGTVGPTRMDYATAIGGVRYISDVMDHFLQEIHRGGGVSQAIQ